jgi:hypothetical protein
MSTTEPRAPLLTLSPALLGRRRDKGPSGSTTRASEAGEQSATARRRALFVADYLSGDADSISSPPQVSLDEIERIMI